MNTAPTPPATTWSTPSWVRLALAFAVLGLAGYGFTLGDFFLADDFASLTRVSRSTRWIDASVAGETFSETWLRPLPMWTWYWNYQWFGTDPMGYRVFNLLLHVANAVLLAWLVQVLVRSRLAGCFAGAAFTVFPNHPEAVTWICARYDLLCTTGVLACLLAWTRYLCPGGRGRHLGLACFAAAVALASKEMALSLPFLVVGVTVVFFRPLRRRALVGLLALAGIVIVYLGVRFVALGGMGGMTVDGASLHTGLSPSRARFLRRALVSSFAPANSELYPSLWHPLKLLPLLAVAPAFVLCRRALVSRQCLATAGAFFLLFVLSLAPVAGWAHLPLDNHNTRFLYLPTAFSCALLATPFLFIRELANRRDSDILVGTGLAAIALATWLTGVVLENRNWHEAARRSKSMLFTLPLSESGSERIRVTGIPSRHHGAPMIEGAITGAVELFTDYPGIVRQLDDAEWRDQRDREPPDGPNAFYRWDGRSETWIRE